jgi:hypothetical protein
MQTAPRRSLAAAAALSAAVVPGAHAQPLQPHDSGAPRFLNMVHHTLRPGRAGAYHDLEHVIARAYARLQIPAYWVELQSITGRPAMLALNLFNSFDEVERAMSGIGAATAADPELKRLQEELLTNISDERSVLTVRRDDIVGRAPPLNLATTMRLLRVTTLTVAPGQDAALAGALRAACAESASPRPAGRCLVYEADAGVGNPTFVLLVPFMSLADVGMDIADRHGLASAPVNSPPGPRRSLPDLAKAACSSACTAVESEIYVVNPDLSHMPAGFTASDPAYWTPSIAKPQPSH